MERFAICHHTRPHVHGEGNVTQEDGRHVHGALHQRVISDSGIWKPHTGNTGMFLVLESWFHTGISGWVHRHFRSYILLCCFTPDDDDEIKCSDLSRL